MKSQQMECPDSAFMESEKANGSIAQPMSSVNGAPSLSSHRVTRRRASSLGSNISMRSRDEKPTCKKCLLDNVLTLATLLAVVLGIALGAVLRSTRTWSKREVMYVNYPGELFLNMLKGLILPLIFSSLIAAVGSLDIKLSGKIGIRAIAYYMITTLIAIILGIILVVSIRPGEGKESDVKGEDNPDRTPTLPEDTLMDLVRHMFPPNIVAAAVQQLSTALIVPRGMENVTNTTVMRTWDFEEKVVNQSNILGIVVFSIVLGITLAYMKDKGTPLLDVVTTLSDAIMIITKAVIWLSPVGILFLVTSKILEMKDMAVVAGQIGLYTITVLSGLLIHGVVILPLIYFVLTRKNPLRFVINMGQALATAFGTSSSSATLPITIACLEEKNFVDPRVARFVLPIGATVNMDGTALYEAVAAIFIAQVRKIDLSLGNIIAISITSTAASIGAAGIPQAGLVTMVMVLNVVGLPAEDVALILVVDWMLDRFRTLINVTGDAFGAAIVGHFTEMSMEEINEVEGTNTQTTPL